MGLIAIARLVEPKLKQSVLIGKIQKIVKSKILIRLNDFSFKFIKQVSKLGFFNFKARLIFTKLS